MGIRSSKVKPQVETSPEFKLRHDDTSTYCLSRNDSGVVEVKPGVFVLQTNQVVTKMATVVPKISPVTKLPTYTPKSGSQECSNLNTARSNADILSKHKGVEIQRDSWYSAPRPKLQISV